VCSSDLGERGKEGTGLGGRGRSGNCPINCPYGTGILYIPAA
jgi:hypothetical protein